MNWLEQFERAGAVWRWPGHGPHAAYRLSPHHADFYLNTDVVTADLKLVGRIVREGFAPWIDATLPTDWIVAPISSIAAGLILATSLARGVNARVAYYDLRTDAWSTPIPPGARAIVCTDDVHGGGSARRTITGLRARNVIVTQILTLANFSDHTRIEGLAITSLLDHRFGVWATDACPLCAAGSAAIDARERWSDLVRSASDTK